MCANANSMLMLPQERYSALKELAEQTDVKKLLYAINCFVDIENGLKYALSPLMLFEATALKVASSTGEVDYDGLNRRLTRIEQLPNNISGDSQSLYVVDKTDPKSIWRGVKLSLTQTNDALLMGVWSDVKVEFDADRNFVIRCSEGSYWLIENKYKALLQSKVAALCDKKVIIVKEQPASQSELDRQLSALGTDVKFN